MIAARRPGTAMSTIRIAAATRTAMTIGEIVPMSDQFNSLLLSSANRRRRQECLSGGTEEIEHKAREEPEHDDQDPERQKRDELRPVHVGQVAPETLEELGHRAKRQPLEHPQQ